MKIAFRLDDITPDMDMDKFHKVREIFEKADIKPLIGVVPDCQDELLRYEEKKEDFWDLVRELQENGWLIAQHGYQHVYETKDTGILGINPFSEFAGLSYEKQLDKLQKGKGILEKQGVFANIFMAPGHTYDRNTIKALKICGFSYVTDGYTTQNYMDEGICFIPCRNEKKTNDKGINTICLHANLMKEADFQALENRINSNRSWYVDFDVLVNEPAQSFTFLRKMQQWKNLQKYKLRRKIGKSRIAQKYFEKCKHANPVIRKLNKIIYAPILLAVLFEKIEVD